MDAADFAAATQLSNVCQPTSFAHQTLDKMTRLGRIAAFHGTILSLNYGIAKPFI